MKKITVIPFRPDIENFLGIKIEILFYLPNAEEIMSGGILYVFEYNDTDPDIESSDEDRETYMMEAIFENDLEHIAIITHQENYAALKTLFEINLDENLYEVEYIHLPTDYTKMLDDVYKAFVNDEGKYQIQHITDYIQALALLASNYAKMFKNINPAVTS